MKVHPDSSMSASSRVPDTWQAIDWRHVERTVRGMQVRIAKATRECDWRKVKALQRLLTRSFCGKALAVRRVTENQGKRTAGVDRELWETPTAKRDAIDTLNRRGYRPSPLRRVRIPKGNGKTRMLGIPTMRDRAMQALYLLALAPVAESTADPNSYGFRIGRSTADAMARGFQLLSRSISPKWVLDADIEGCFDHLDHEWLLIHVPMDRVMLRKWLNAGVVDLGRFYRTESGTPQGGIISPTLANLALDGLEPLLRERFGANNRKSGIRPMVNLVRYADDFIITGSSQELLANEVVPMVRTFLAERGLRLSEAKTRIVSIDRGFDFLGWNFRFYNGKLLIKPSKKNVKAFLGKVREIIKSNTTSKQANLIRQLNPVIRGWTNYHRNVVAKQTFAKVDHQLFDVLWRWAIRRHRNKDSCWIAGRYWSSYETQSWMFVDRFVKPASGKSVRLLSAAEVPIQRHVKVKADYCPFDPDWDDYGEARRIRGFKRVVGHRSQLTALFHRQDGVCDRCQHAITHDTGWHVHHVVPRQFGGGDSLDNLVLLHPTCHAAIHNRQNGCVAG
ncbi:MAG: group II intron reverse transcriptase/maturase [Gammaproteobacteria bacterium]|nr:group II intron reverse transcriptase/maturase [Gammaproteobacteria bacterium]